MNELLKLITGMVGDKLPIGAALELAPVLVPILRDLTDGDPRLSAEHRNLIAAKIQDLKLAGKL